MSEDSKCSCNLCDMIEKTTWVSVKDRLPEDQQYCLCWDGEDIYLIKFVQTSDGRSKKRKGYFEDSYEWYFKEITHWMPLPEPPNE